MKSTSSTAKLCWVASMLRERLTAACDQVTPEQNIERIKEIAAEIPHNIVSHCSEHDLTRFTCVMHVLGFVGQDRYAAVATLPPHNVYAGKEFVDWLITSERLTEIDAAQAEVDSIVMYFDDCGAFTHVGLLVSHSRIQSKWGTLALYEHDLFEVPSNYGSTVRYFVHLPYKESIELFYEFAVEKGVKVE